ncbi:c-type cytochrome [Mangrovimicrobium sediminis]|uniref:C-type cytochrome n=1 Tax=Mangrovimicrobium sediminis TaxID=2562682 RepID=A0A4Z0M8E0_9GAMM|nr:c-type cytochrome [Haliea sp. SAOS-164]TGD75801.1 c-type cytochrome [Haliea sp. SAOS-164]
MKQLLPPIWLGTLLLAGVAQAQDAAGEQRYAPCASCHGDAAQGDQAQGAPRLNHLSAVYITAQLEKFSAGQRGGADASPQAQAMAAMARTLPDEQAMLEVAVYISALDSPASPATVAGDPALGADYYRQLCGACHAAGAVGNKALHSPRLAGSDDWYLQAQLEAFRSGQRGAHPDDRTGRQMRAMAATLPDDQAVRNVVAYLRELAEPAE